MKATTKKYKLEANQYIKIGMLNILKDWWWVWIIPAVIMLIPIFVKGALGWCIGISITLSILYLLFWLIQFAGIAQLPQYKQIFEKMSYEIDSRQILMKVSVNQGMPINWNQIQGVDKKKDHYLFKISKAQFIYLPFSIFTTPHDLKVLETILKRKNLIN